MTGQSSGLIAPTVSTDLMSHHLRMIAQEAGDEVHVVLVLDGAGWHKAKNLPIPESMTLHFLPPYSPELMPMERVWPWMRQHDLSHRIFENEAAIDQACIESWTKLTPERPKNHHRNQLVNARVLNENRMIPSRDSLPQFTA